MIRHRSKPLLAAWMQLPALLAEAGGRSSSRRDSGRGTSTPFANGASALCLSVAMLAPEFAFADPRDTAGPSEPLTPEMDEAKRDQKAHDMAEWLPRLVGRYRLAGQEVLLTNAPSDPKIPPPPPKVVRGKADCVPVGSGPGVQCVIHVEWDRSTSWSSAWLNSNAPTIILYGLDPLAGRIRYLQVDHSSIAQQGEGSLVGDTLY